jgi:hypothetical protein
MAKSIKLKPDQPVRRYVGIDVTKALDTVAWGHLWNATFGWQNLVWNLDKDPADTTKQTRVDKAHSKMPIKRLVRTHGGNTFADTCIMPEGVDGSGTDATFTAADMTGALNFMHTFILAPGADKAASELNDTATGVGADVVMLSSHGLFSGDMFGTGDPFQNLFEPSKVASLSRQFAGPGWLILSNCSTLNSATHGDWLKLMSGPTPLRGIVGFQHGCPLESGSVDFLALFINKLALGKTFVNAWKEAVSAIVSPNNWIVVCHRDAKDDTIADWNDNSLTAIAPGAPVLLFDNTNTGTTITPQPDPFDAFWSKGGTRITLSNRRDPANRLKAGDTVVITVQPPASAAPPAATFTAGTAIAITLIYIRPDYNQAIDVTKMFTVVGQTGAGAPTTAKLNSQGPGTSDDSWKLTVTGTPTEVTLTLKCVDLTTLHDTGMELKLRVDISTQAFTFDRNGVIIEEK